MTKDYYKILGLAEFETAENIKKAYHRLARIWHPDVAGNTKDVLLRFKEINEAYEILSNKSTKEIYDRARKFYNYTSETKEPKKATEKQATNPQKTTKSFHFSWESFINNSYFNKKEEEKKSPKNGENINTDIEITFLEALNGTTKKINMLQTQVCKTCNGRKFINGGKCPHCEGKGSFASYKKFSVKIPAGVKNNSKIRLAGEGCEGYNGGKRGDLYITIHIQETKTSTNIGNDIQKILPITPFEAVLGANIKFSTDKGLFSIKILPNTQNGQKIRLTGCGNVQNDKVGDMILTVEIRIPKNLTQQELDLYKQLESISSNSVRDSI